MQVITMQKSSNKKSTDKGSRSTLLIFSDAASIVKMGWLQRMEQLFPHHRSIVLHGSHHFPQEYDSASVTAEIRNWLDETIAK